MKWNAVKVAQSCLTLYYHMGYTFHGILQARLLEWVAFPFSKGSPQPRDQTRVSCITGGFFTDWAIREYRISLLYTWNTVHQLHFNKKKIHDKKYYKI